MRLTSLQTSYVGRFGGSDWWRFCLAVCPPFLWSSIHVLVGGRLWHCAQDPPRRRRGAGGPIDAPALCCWTAPSPCGHTREIGSQRMDFRTLTTFTFSPHIRTHGGKTHVWNVAGIEPRVCDALQRIAEASDPSARVWGGADIPTHSQGIRVLGAPVGHPDFIRAQLEMTQAEHQVLLNRIPSLPDLQSAWSLLLHCASVGQTTSCVSCRLSWERSSPGLTTVPCGRVCAP